MSDRRIGPIARWVSLTLFCIALVGVASPATAQDLSADEVETFQKLMAQGSQAYADGEYERSISSLREAQKLYDHPDLVYNIGRAYTRLRRCSEARRAFITYLQRPEITEEDDRKARKNLQELTECVEPARLTIECTPRDASVAVDDGQKSDTCPAQFEVEPGEHQITVSAAEHRPASRTTVLKEGESAALQIALEREADDPTEVVSSRKESSDGSWRPVAGWSAIGGGAAMLVTGLVLDSTSSARGARLREAAEDEDEATVDTLERRARTIRAATIALYAGGLVAAATGSALVIWGSSGPDGDASAGATVTLKF